MSMIEGAYRDVGMLIDEAVIDRVKGIHADVQFEYDADVIDYLVEFEGALAVSNFTGEAIRATDTGESNESDSIKFDDDRLAYFPAAKAPALFVAAYSGIDEIADEFRDRFGAFFPADYDYANNIRVLFGTYYG